MTETTDSVIGSADGATDIWVRSNEIMPFIVVGVVLLIVVGVVLYRKKRRG